MEVYKLKDIANVSSGNSAPQEERFFRGGENYFIRTSDVGKIKKGVIYKSRDLLTNEATSKMRFLRKGTILFPKSGASTFLNHRVIMECSGYASSHLATITGNTQIVTDKYLLYYLYTIDARDLIQDSNYPSVRLTEIKEIQRPVPSLAIQNAIVSKLDHTFEAIDEEIKNTEKQIKNSEELFKSSINSLLSEESADNIQSTLRDLTTKIGSGATPKGGKSSYKIEGISLIRSMNVHDLQFKKKDLAFIDDNQADKLNNVTLEADDVLLNITGASISRTCIVPKGILPARVNQHVSIIRAKKDQIRPKLLNLILYSEKYKNEILGIGEKGATRQAITKGQLESLIVKFPKSLEKQDILIEKANFLLEKTRMLKDLNDSKLKNLFELKISILESAFKGELV